MERRLLLTMPLAAMLVFGTHGFDVTSTEASLNVTEGDDYYSSYEYQDINATAQGSEPGVIPDPGLQDMDEAESGAPEPLDDVELPDNSLADPDLHDHDLIDSVMYIYFGQQNREQSGAGRQVLVIGAVLALGAQLLALAAALRRLRSTPRDAAALVFLNTEVSLATSNLVLMLGVQATGDRQWCEAVALLLHYLHLVACCWFFAVSVHVFRRARDVLHFSCPLCWLLPALIVLGCYVLNPKGYETRHFCWMSVERGMVLSFMVPVGTLIIANTVLVIISLRAEASKEGEGTAPRRAAATLLPAFAVVWFLGVLALENPATLLLPLLFAATNGLLNWFLFIFSSLVLPESECLQMEDLQPATVEADIQPLLTVETSSQPLWAHAVSSHHSGGELLELRLDTISTISS